ncbi:ribonucleotide-diphosphate reductase subunit beta [Amphritea sp. HPY]|uniref:ribonucleotide-diphosphate reductase subunit beta n=1 Tax=Amphritea sp. HPY TaxID=3421652 RepID=UPI003D7E4AA0
MSMMRQFSPTYKPFHYPWAMELTTAHEDDHWTEQELDLGDDVKDWKNNLTPEEKNLVSQILRLFTQSDVQVGQNYADFFIPVFKNNELRNWLYSVMAREGTHQRAYAMINETLNLPDSEFSVFLEYSEMSDKATFMGANDTTDDRGIALALAKTVFSEGVSLFGAFAMLLNFQRYGKMKGMCEAVRWSIIDETSHVQGAARMFRTFCEEHPHVVTDELKRDIYSMAREVEQLENKYLDLAFELGDVEGLSKAEMKTYVKYLLDRRLLQLGLKENFGVEKNPLKWFDEIMGSASHVNFFEGRVTDYQVVGMTGEWDDAY